MTGGRDDAIDRRAWVALLLASSCALVVGLGVTAVNVAFPAIERDFSGTSRSTLSWGLTGYSITLASLVLVGGRLADRLGRRRIFRLGVTIFTVGSLALAMAPSALVFVAARVTQGVGAAFSSPASLALVLPLFPGSRRVTAIATWTSVGTLGSAIGPSLSAVVTQQLSWRWIFVFPLVLTVGAVVLAPRLLPEGAPPPGDRPEGGIVDAVGVVQGIAAVALLAYAIIAGPSLGWTSPQVLVSGATALALAPLFVRRSLHRPNPLLDPRLFRVRTVWSANLANVFLSASGLSVWLVYPLFLVQHWHYSLLRTGLAITPFPAIAAVTGVISGRLADRHGVRTVIAVGSLIPLLGAALLVLRLTGEPAYVRDFLPGAALYSTGFGLIFSPLTAAALRGVDVADLGQANAAFNAVRQLGGALGIAVVIAILGDADVIPLDHFDRAYLAIAGMTLLGWLVVAAFYPRAADRDHAVDIATSPATAAD